ncbi:MAG: aminotransferase class V-fold PLP-dependent enzyme [Turneriella sp.]|nr:aminotransferase class V-fold PLP-dependent enzyme [Turneriella sp.]
MQKDIRAGFPFFPANPGIVYLDSAATSLKPQGVIDALTKYNARESVNIHRGVYRLSQRATDTVETVRKKAAEFVSDAAESTAVFTKGTTDSFNLLAHTLTSAKSDIKDFFPAYTSAKPAAILLSDSEHHANIVPWQIFAAERGYKIFFIPVDGDGNFAPPENFLEDISASHTVRIISLSLQSNVTGIIHDLAPYRTFAAETGAVFIIDAAQAVIHAPETIKALNPDFVCYSAHKLFGATGVGVLVGRKPVLDNCDVYQGGGGMIALVEREKSTYLEAPAKFEAGTQAVGEIYAFGAALDFAGENQSAIHSTDNDLRHYADERLQAAGIRVFGLSAKSRSPIYSFEIPGVHAHDTGTLLDEQDICVRAGHHCCQLLMRSLGVPASARASFLFYNTRDDVDRLIDGIGYVKKIFRK